MSFYEEFDYHLSPSEQSQVEKCVPMHQAKIHLAFRANIKIDDKIINKGAVALSEHMITICAPGFLRKTLKLYETFHLFDIKSVVTVSNEEVKMKIKDQTINIVTPTCMRFVRNTLRNFILSNPSLPANLRFHFKCHDASFFPPFNPQLSPSQIFQFTYNAFCSYYDTTYYHDIPMYYHKLLSTGTCVFDLTKLPIKVLECGLGDAAEIKPITKALLYSPFIFGFSCAHFARPDIISAISPLVRINQALKMIRIVDAGAVRGAIDIANAMVKSESQQIIYWDFSDNQLEDMQAFVHALGEYEAEVQAVILNNCGMTDLTVATLFESLTENESMHFIEQLSILGSRVIESNCELFCNLLETIAESTEEDGDAGISLKVLALSNVEDPSSIVATLKQVNTQLITFKLHDTILSNKAVSILCDFLRSQKRLKTLSLDGCTIDPERIIQIIATIGVSQDINSINLSLGRMKLYDSSFDIVLQALLDHLPLKLFSLGLDGNKMTVNNLRSLCERIHLLTQLKSLSLSQNFTSSMKDVSYELCQVLKAPVLEELIIRGDDYYKLKTELIQLICSLQTAKTITSIDFSNNSIGDIGLKTLSNLVIASLQIKQIAADGSDPTSFDAIDKFLYILETDAELIGAPLPVEDVYTQVAEKDEKTQQRLIENVTTHQMRLQDALMKNRARAGIHSDLSLLKDPILDDLLDEATLQMQALLQNCNLTQHLAITEIVGLPLPFERPPTHPTSTCKPADNDSQGDDYVDPVLMSQISEKKDDITSQLQTLQFNSLLIRRPNAAQRLANKAALFIKPSTFDPDNPENESSDYDEEEDEEEEEEEPTEQSSEKTTKTKKGHRLLPSKIEMLAPVEFDIENAPDPSHESEFDEPDLKSPLV